MRSNNRSIIDGLGNLSVFLTERIIRVTRYFPSTVEIRLLERVVGFGRSPDILQTWVVKMGFAKNIRKHVLPYWRIYVVILTPVFLLPLPILATHEDQEGHLQRVMHPVPTNLK